MAQKITIGFSQLIKPAWINMTIQQKLKGQAPKLIRAKLDKFLSNQVAVGSTAKGNTRQKTISILSKMWLNVPKPIESFRDDGLTLFKRLPKKTRIAVYWGMAIASYPFFATCAEIVGRLLRLQNDITTAQVQKRITEKMGEKEAIKRAVRQLINSWVEWGILKPTDNKGQFVATDLLILTDTELTTWILESALISSQGDSARLHSLVNYSPALFPFKLSSNYFIPNERIETFNQGVNDVSVALSDYNVEPIKPSPKVPTARKKRATKARRRSK
jgi:hypothetical protein